MVVTICDRCKSEIPQKETRPGPASGARIEFTPVGKVPEEFTICLACRIAFGYFIENVATVPGRKREG